LFTDKNAKKRPTKSKYIVKILTQRLVWILEVEKHSDSFIISR